MILNKTICDRCGAEISCTAEPHPPLLVRRSWKKSEKCTVSSGYRDTQKIHLCEDCAKHFEEFMNYER